MHLTVLGTASPYPRPDNACSGYLLTSSGGVTIWVETGTGTLAELQRHIALVDVDAIWVSHRHADHLADLLVAYYALRFSALRPTRRIPLIGPQGLIFRLGEFLGPGAEEGLEQVFDITEMHDWGDAVVGDLSLSWGPVAHGVPAFAVTVRQEAESADGPAAATGDATVDAKVDATGRAGFTFSGDSAPCRSLVEMAENSETLLCEVGYALEMLGDGAEHHTPEDAGRTATQAGVNTLILTHLSDDLEAPDALRRARAAFGGRVLLAEPGSTFEV